MAGGVEKREVLVVRAHDGDRAPSHVQAGDEFADLGLHDLEAAIPQQQGAANPITSVANTPAAGIPVPLELWVAFRKIPYIGTIRIGNQKAPYGFERLTSSQ